MKAYKLSSAQRQLLDIWKKEFTDIRRSLDAVCNEALTARLEKLAQEMGINVNDGSWKFDLEQMAFIQDVPSDMVEKKRGRPKKEESADETQLSLPEPQA